jgi:uncharacterized protein (TIGR02246 family)
MNRSRRLLVLGVGALMLGLLPAPGRTETDDESAIKAAVIQYFASVRYPDPPPIDPECFAPDVLGLWSNGEIHRGRKAFLRAHKEGAEEVARSFATLEVEPEIRVLRHRGDLAWLHVETTMAGALKEEKRTFERSIRTTFVLEKREGRWQIVHEHSSRVRPR